ncbi:DUF3493 domain-containing protein [Synechococcus sp. CC9616]|uniref:DUF3493 domain-containing protein n=1 Tax=Synechococcus sp. CC9616 TaxID=110663 RepID=UPI0012EB4E04|nr:DUF3493 domain-containing protein [Synechococcus sp. CC9616]
MFNLSDPQKRENNLDPELRRRLIQESQTPWRGLRRALWFALFASAGLGLFTMAFRASAGGAVEISDLGIQVGALILFASLLWFDRQRSSV